MIIIILLLIAFGIPILSIINSKNKWKVFFYYLSMFIVYFLLIVFLKNIWNINSFESISYEFIDILIKGSFSWAIDRLFELLFRVETLFYYIIWYSLWEYFFKEEEEEKKTILVNTIFVSHFILIVFLFTMSHYWKQLAIENQKRYELQKSIENLEDSVTECVLNWKKFTKPINSSCANDNINAWICNKWYYEKNNGCLKIDYEDNLFLDHINKTCGINSYLGKPWWCYCISWYTWKNKWESLDCIKIINK